MVPRILESKVAIDSCRYQSNRGVLSIWQKSLGAISCMGRSGYFNRSDFTNKPIGNLLGAVLSKAAALDFSCATACSNIRLAQLCSENRDSIQQRSSKSGDRTVISETADEQFKRTGRRLAAFHLNAAQCALDGKMTRRCGQRRARTRSIQGKPDERCSATATSHDYRATNISVTESWRHWRSVTTRERSSAQTGTRFLPRSRSSLFRRLDGNQGGPR